MLYAPQALGIAAGRVVFVALGMQGRYTLAAQMYCGRLVNLMVFIIIVFAAIRIIPIMKQTIAMTALLPMPLSLAASLSRDALLISSAFLALALIFRLLAADEGYRARRWELGLLAATAAVLLVCKTVYFPLIGLLLLVPADRFGGSKQRLRALGLVVGVAAAVFVIHSGLVAWRLRGYTASGTELVHAQAWFVLKHPFELIGITLQTLSGMRANYLASMIGVLGWLDTSFPFVFVVVCVVLLVATAALDATTTWDPGWKVRLGLLAVILVSGAAIFVGVYVTWTSIVEDGGVGAKSVLGVQGRYFLPLLPLALLLLRNRLAPRLVPARDALARVTPPLLIAVQAYTCVIVLLRYWIPQP